MIRTILFKAKTKDTGEWVNCELDLSKHFSIVYYLTDYEVDLTRLDSKTICYFSGVYDKNKQPIFENDIVRHTGYHGNKESTVVFSDGCFNVGYHSGSSTRKTPMLLNSKMVVVGNIHDK
jgi:hypothetical protein